MEKTSLLPRMLGRKTKLNEWSFLVSNRSSSKQGIDMSADGKTLVQRAYELQSQEESTSLYRDWASTYDETMVGELGYLTPQRTAELLAQYCTDRSSRVLDIGCGTGLAGVELKRLGFTPIDALDYPADMLDVARSRSVYQNFYQADLMQPLPFLEDASYDALICTGTFTHAHVDASCLETLFRVLAVNGYFACTIHHGVWHASGFKDSVAALIAHGKVKTLHQQAGIYYAGANEKEGDYIVWQRAL